MQIMDESKFYGRYNYDNIFYYNLIQEKSQIIGKLVSEKARGNPIITDEEIIANLLKFIDEMHTLAKNYTIIRDITITYNDIEITLDDYYYELTKTTHLKVQKTIDKINLFSNLFFPRMAIEADMRKRMKDPTTWTDKIKKRLQFINWSEEEEQYLNEIHFTLNKSIFLLTHFLVKEKGDIHMLMSGDNGAGKSTTTIKIIYGAHQYLTNFYGIEMPGWRLRDHIAFMNEKKMIGLFTQEPYWLLAYNEGNFSNINLRSLDPETIAETQVAFGARNHHPFVVYNYQNSSRPTLFLRERFNIWFHKVHKVDGFLMIRSRIALKEDPWLSKKLSKADSDIALYNFFKYHPYTVKEFKKLKALGPRLQERYDKWEIKAQADWAEKRGMAQKGEEAYNEAAVILYKRMYEGSRSLLPSELKQEMVDMGFTKPASQTKLKQTIDELEGVKNWEKFKAKRSKTNQESLGEKSEAM